MKGFITFGNNEINKLKSKPKNSRAGGPRTCLAQAGNSKYHDYFSAKDEFGHGISP